MVGKYVVARSENKLFATRWHDTIESARQEAERLARKENAAFLVFKLVGKCKPPKLPVQWEMLDPEMAVTQLTDTSALTG